MHFLRNGHLPILGEIDSDCADRKVWGKNVKGWVAAACLCAGCAQASTLGDAIIGGNPLIDVRARYENVDDAGKAITGQATTLRARLGYETGTWQGFKFALEIDQIWVLGGAYNSTRNGKSSYAVIADPPMTALNRLQLSYHTDFDTTITVGRQRLLIGNQRFIGNSGWRQHEQTFDAVSVVNNSVPDLAVTYVWLDRANRIAGPSRPVPDTTPAAATGQATAFKSDSHLFDAVYSGFPGWRLEGYTFLLDLSAPGYTTAPAQKIATTKLSTATYGGRAEYTAPVVQGLKAKLAGEYAHQTNYADNPLSYGLDYGLAEGSLAYGPVTATGGYEVMGGNGTIGFSTPLATLHAFDGWADMFLSTPVNGLVDAYFKMAAAIPVDSIGLKGLTATLIRRDWSTDHTGKGIGGEWDAAAELAIDAHASLLLQYADYQGSNIAAGGFPDKSLFWVQAAYKY